MGGAILHNCCDCECLRFFFAARVHPPSGPEFRQATLSHTADCRSQPPVAVTPFDRQFAYRPTNQFTISVVSPPATGGPWYHTGWTIEYPNEPAQTASRGDLALEIEQGIGHGVRVIAEFHNNIEQPVPDCGDLSLDVPQFLQVDIPSAIDFDAKLESDGERCHDYGGAFTRYTPNQTIILQCANEISPNLVPASWRLHGLMGNMSRLSQSLVRYEFRNTAGVCMEAFLWDYWYPIVDADGNWYFKPYVTCFLPLEFMTDSDVVWPSGGYPNGPGTVGGWVETFGTSSFNRQVTQVIFSKTLSLGNLVSDNALALLYKGIDETACATSPNELCVGASDTSLRQAWVRTGYTLGQQIQGPFKSPLRTFESQSESTMAMIGTVGSFPVMYSGALARGWLTSNIDGFFFHACENHSVDPDRPWGTTKEQHDSPQGLSYDGVHAEDVGVHVGDVPDEYHAQSFAISVQPTDDTLWPNHESKCVCVDATAFDGSVQSLATSRLYLRNTDTESQPCILDCYSASPDYARSDIFPPKIRLILPKHIDQRFLDVAPNCTDYAHVGKLYERACGKTHIMGATCATLSHVSADTIGPDSAIWPFATLYNVGSGIANENISVWTAEYKFGDGTGCVETSRVFIDIGWVNNYSGGYGCGSDTEIRHILFTQCRIMHVSLGVWSNQPQCDFYAINFAAEFNRGDFDDLELDSTGIINNPWNWRSQNFVFEAFYNERLYGDHPNIPLNPDDARDCAFSMNPLRYRYSMAHKIYGGIIDDFCVDPDQVPCYYPLFPGSQPTDPVPFANLELCAYGSNHSFGFKVEPWYRDPVDARCIAGQNDDFIRYDEVTP